jgi:hypothetical protein
MTPQEFEHTLELMKPEQPEDWAWWRGLGCGLCISGIVWIVASGGIWAAFKGAM